MAPAKQAAVWGILGGIPLYLEWWDERASLRANLEALVCAPGAPLLTAGELMLASDIDAGDLARQVVYAIAAGKTKHNEIADLIRADPTRVLDRLVRIGIVERMTPVTEDPRRTRRRLYRVADNFLAFWLGVVDRHRAAIERGLGSSVLPVMLVELDDHLGIPWEEAVRIHLRRLAAAGELGPDVVAVGRYWTATQPPVEIDGVVLAGRSRTAVAVAEAKWARRVDGAAVARGLCSSGSRLPSSSSSASREAALRASRSSVSSSEGGGSGTIRSSHPERLSPPSRVHGHDVLVRRVEAERPRDAFVSGGTRREVAAIVRSGSPPAALRTMSSTRSNRRGAGHVVIWCLPRSGRRPPGG